MSYLGPDANPVDYAEILASVKNDVEVKIAQFANLGRQVPQHLLMADYLLSVLNGTVGGGGGGGGGLTPAQLDASLLAAGVTPSLQVALNAVNGNTDGLEAALASVISGLSALDGNTDGIEGSLTDIISALSTLESLLNQVDNSVIAVQSAITSPIGVTPALSRPTGSGTVVAGFAKVSIANAGIANGTISIGVNTTTLKPGEVFDFGDRNVTLPEVSYDATGTEFIILTELEDLG